MMNEWAVHMAPEVIGFVLTLLIHQPEAAPDDAFHHCHPCAAQVSLVHHFHPHGSFEWVLHTLRHLEATQTHSVRTASGFPYHVY